MDSYRAVISFFILICFNMGQTLRCVCKKDFKTCTSIYDRQVNFKKAQEACMENGGKLLTTSSKSIDNLLFNKTGRFWIGTDRDCLSRSRQAGGDFVTLTRGRKDVACSSKCMMVSSNRNLIERSCEEQADGFLCDDIEWETCWENKASEVQILNENDCQLGPCDHECMEVPGGHMCSCFLKYRISKHPEHCEYLCESHTCPMPNGLYKCPDGFVKDETQCIDIDECTSNHNCDQGCKNTLGYYKCFCYDGFKLVNKSKCVVTTSLNYTSSHAAFETPAEYIGLTLLVILVISALVGLLYYLRKKKSDLLLKDTDATEDVRVQETQLQL